MPNIEADRFIHVVAGLIRRAPGSDEFLIARRRQGSHLEGLWEFPGGKMESGENRFQALRRELLEELGIVVRQAIPLHSVFHRYPDRNIHLDVWEVFDFDGQLGGRESQEIRWISPEDIPDFEFPEADRPILAALRLPPRLLITPDISPGHEESFQHHFSRLMVHCPYPLVQFRSHNLEDKHYLDIANSLQTVCQSRGGELIINRGSFKSYESGIFDNFRYRHLNSRLLALLSDAPFDDDMHTSASCHDEAELKIAERIGCEFAILSTIRNTLSHPGRSPKGWRGFKKMTGSVNLPLYALGGVRRNDFSAARYQGAVGVAGISDFWSGAGITGNSGKA